MINTTSITGASTVVGSNIASATPSATSTSADLVSAATNTGGIIITSLSMSISAAADPATLNFKINGSVTKRISARGGAGLSDTSLGGFCNIKIPAGQAVGYSTSFTDGSGSIFITWKAA